MAHGYSFNFKLMSHFHGFYVAVAQVDEICTGALIFMFMCVFVCVRAAEIILQLILLQILRAYVLAASPYRERYVYNAVAPQRARRAV